MKNINSDDMVTVLLTAKFPWDKVNEAFIESEIGYHKNPVFIFPSRNRRGEPKRDIPDNCVAYAVGKHGSGIFSLIFSLISILWCKQWWEEVTILKKSGKMRPYTFALLVNFAWISLLACRNAKKHLLRNGVDRNQRIVFYAHWLYDPAFTALLLQKHFPNSIVVSRNHRYDIYEQYARDKYIPMRTLFVREISHHFPENGDGYKYLVNTHGIAKDKITIARLAARDYGIAVSSNRDVLRIVSCSYVVGVKRIPLLIEALSQIGDIPIRWTHFGSGPLFDESTELADSLLSPVKNIKYEWKGAVPNPEIMAYYKDNPFHLFINVSESEGVPVSIMEALSFGIPVIATAVGGVSEIIESGVNGKLLPQYVSSAEIAENVKYFWNVSDDDYVNYRKNARKIWEKMSNAEVVYPEFVDCIQKLANSIDR
ncbi:MAG: glycosyltransferase [Oscillospiraceae bacterium]|nr:glycosyltransferase [Oscillospiraceae bacterium]MCL2279920.1 glycosyltransferase [Oscillospiraceae bacterium]